MSFRAIVYALSAAVLFGLSTPAAKALIGAVDPRMLAGLFYIGSGVGLAAWRVARGVVAPGTRKAAEAPLGRADLPWLAGAIASGGVVGPVLLMAGLARTEATTASLLLTLEGVATALIAWFAFRENVNRRIALGMLSIAAGAAELVWQEGVGFEGIVGPLALVGACIAWGIDNNLTRRVSLADPVTTTTAKGLVAGPVTAALAVGTGAAFPAPGIALAAAGIGFFSYGISLIFFVLAVRELGVARTSAYFATAPFLGAAAAIPLLGEPVRLQFLAAGGLMVIGVWLHVTERHVHTHRHEATKHTHRHVHDIHHQHGHAPGTADEPHSHAHVHQSQTHAHPHMPDSHHHHAH